MQTFQAQTFSASEAAELALIQRSGFIESRHLGAAVVLDPNGKILASLGNIKAPIFARSALKPLQTIASMNAGAELQGAQIALASGSHIGSFEHIKVAQEILQEAGLTAQDLQCPPAWPAHEPSLHALIKAGRGKTPLAFNCSGKHSAFLWACVKNNWDTATYRDPQHPLQQQVLKTISQWCQEEIPHIAVDGCGAPLAATSLLGLTKAYSALGNGIENIHADARIATVATAMVDYPEFVQGQGKPNTVLSEMLGAVVKGGAEGVLAIGLKGGASVCVKILDGSSRALALTALTLLDKCGLIDSQLAQQGFEATTLPITGALEPVGAIELGADLADFTFAD